MQPPQVNEPVFQAIRHALSGLEYGHLQLIVHEGRVVRIERVEKIRVPSSDVNVQTSTGPSGD